MDNPFAQYQADFILERMFSRIKESIDKREGSVIYDSLAPAAIEMDILYQELNWVLKNMFAITAERFALERISKEVGIEAFPATAAILKGEFDADVPLGSSFYAENNNFIVSELIEQSDGVYYFKMICEQLGEIGNIPLAKLLPNQTVSNLTKAKVIEIITPGQEEEETEHLRERYLQKVREPATSGNIYHYRRWCMEVQGVGAAKVFPLHNGNGTVKLIVVDQEMQTADEELLRTIRLHIEEKRPIGATVTVSSAHNKELSVSARVRTVAGASLQGIQDEFSTALKEHFKQISFKSRYVSLAKIGSILLSVKNVLDYEELTMNNASANIELTEEEIPLLSEARLEVII